LLACSAALVASAAVAGAQQVHRLDPSPTTVPGGYYEASVRPAVTVRSGDTVVVRSLLGLDPRVLEAHGAKADPMVAEIYRSVTKGPGSHMLTGPIFVDAARPGDLVLTVGAGDVTALAPLVVEALRARSKGGPR
jgi:acetamidase/formamidase